MLCLFEQGLLNIFMNPSIDIIEKGVQMKIELYHASKYGNGAKVAEEFQKLMTMKGHQVNVHHIRETRPMELPQANLYVFGSPT